MSRSRRARSPRLDDLRAAALELLIEAKLALGRHAEVVGRLEALIGEYPYRERLRAQLMLALYRSDRQADALQAYQDARRKLVEELGIEPGERLRDLEAAILAQDPALAAPVLAAVERPPEPVAVAPRRAARPTWRRSTRGARPARRLVSIVFADLVGSTGLAERLDPESMHGLLDRYMEVCGAVIERHGGSVEGFIGDAVVGVFGMTELHEDDALRAVRAAVELRDAGAALSAELERDRGVEIAMKFGVESGEVFLSAGARRSPFAAGDAFNVAARLEGVAPPGEILLGDNVCRLVRGAVRVEPLEPLDRERADGEGAPVSPRRPGGRRGGAAPFIASRVRGARAGAGGTASRLRPSARRTGLPRGDRRRPGRDRQVASRAGAHRRSSAKTPLWWSVGACRTARASPTDRSPKSSGNSEEATRGSGSASSLRETSRSRGWS